MNCLSLFYSLITLSAEQSRSLYSLSRLTDKGQTASASATISGRDEASTPAPDLANSEATPNQLSFQVNSDKETPPLSSSNSVPQSAPEIPAEVNSSISKSPSEDASPAGGSSIEVDKEMNVLDGSASGNIDALLKHSEHSSSRRSSVTRSSPPTEIADPDPHPVRPPVSTRASTRNQEKDAVRANKAEQEHWTYLAADHLRRYLGTYDADIVELFVKYEKKMESKVRLHFNRIIWQY